MIWFDANNLTGLMLNTYQLFSTLKTQFKGIVGLQSTLRQTSVVSSEQYTYRSSTAGSGL